MFTPQLADWHYLPEGYIYLADISSPFTKVWILIAYGFQVDIRSRSRTKKLEGRRKLLKAKYAFPSRRSRLSGFGWTR